MLSGILLYSVYRRAQGKSLRKRFTIPATALQDVSEVEYGSIPVPPGGYKHHEFPPGFSAHWVRVTADRECTATAYFAYT